MKTAAAALAAIAFAAAGAEAAAPLGFDDARHLLNRTGFGASLAEIESFARLGREEAVERLLAGSRPSAALVPAPAWTAAPFDSPRRLRAMDESERRLALEELRRRAFELQAWWLAEMLATPAALTERMTLFWHNHFVSSLHKVRSPQLLYRQNVLLRRHALGNFGALLREIARDPAMLIYLDGASSRKGRPNENFARELMELFTLGEGRYSEADVKEAARAFTGWSVDRASGAALFRPLAHDGGPKTVLGRTGNLDGDAVIAILLERPETAQFIVAKLWREFVSPDPEPREVARVAALFRASGYEIGAALRALLVSDAFYAPRNRAALVKSPVELVVGTLRQLEVRVADPAPFVLVLNALGQRLFAPPTVRGWPGGESWVDATTLPRRKGFLERLLRAAEFAPQAALPAGAARERFPGRMLEIEFDATRWFAPFEASRAGLLERVLLAAAPVQAPAAGPSGLERLRELLLDPVYQLK